MKCCSLLTVAVSLLTCAAQAGLSFDLDHAFSNQNPGDPGYSADFGDVVISLEDHDGDTFLDIRFDLSVNDVDDGVGPFNPNRKLKDFYFNVDPVDGALQIIHTADSAAIAANAFKANGAGFFDALLAFDTSGAGIQSTVFWLTLPGQDLDLSRVFDALDPASTSSTASAKGVFTFAAHVLETDRNGSEFVGARLPVVIVVPEPSQLAGSLTLGLLVWGFARRFW